MADYEIGREGRFWVARALTEPPTDRAAVQETIFDRMHSICQGCRSSGDSKGCRGVRRRKTTFPPEGTILVRSNCLALSSGTSRCKTRKTGVSGRIRS